MRHVVAGVARERAADPGGAGQRVAYAVTVGGVAERLGDDAGEYRPDLRALCRFALREVREHAGPHRRDGGWAAGMSTGASTTAGSGAASVSRTGW
jgi:hypothetical protein